MLVFVLKGGQQEKQSKLVEEREREMENGPREQGLIVGLIEIGETRITLHNDVMAANIRQVLRHCTVIS